MIRILAAAVLLVTAPLTFSAQVEKQITSIRAEVGAINRAAPKYQKKTRSVEGISLEGAEATYFLSGRGLKKITVRIYGETFRATAEFYYSGEEMIFGYRRLERYDTHIAANPPPNVAKVIETRVYYAGGEAIRVVEDKRRRTKADTDFFEAERNMSDLAGKLRAALEQ